MLAPVRVTAPHAPVVSIQEAKRHLRVDHDDDDAMIGALIEAATVHLDGWTGILGRCLVEQVWSQDHDRFARELRIPLGPVISVESVTWRDSAGHISTVASSRYDLRTDAAGRSAVRFDADYDFPSDLHESRAVTVTYKAGHATIPEVPAVPGEGEDDEGTPAVPAQSTVPQPIKVAIMLLVAHWYETREAVNIGNIVNELPFSVNALLAPYRRVGV